MSWATFSQSCLRQNRLYFHKTYSNCLTDLQDENPHPQEVKTCNLCGTSPIGRGYPHTCNEATRVKNLKAKVLAEDSGVKEQIAAAVLREKMLVGKFVLKQRF